MYLLIDDIRDLGADVIARHPMAAEALLPLKIWTKVDFDHDLGLGVKNGYQILCWALENDYLPNDVSLVTSNPVGRQQMKVALIQAGYKTINGINFKKE